MNIPKNVYHGMQKWDNRFLELCIHISEWSEEKGRKVGCVIVGEGNVIVSTGYNGLPRGISSLPEHRHERSTGEKYLWFEHAERNAIYNAARHGIKLSGCRLYSNLFPCSDCTRALIQTGIKELVTFRPPENEATFGRSMEVSLEMLSEAKVEVRLY